MRAVRVCSIVAALAVLASIQASCASSKEVTVVLHARAVMNDSRSCYVLLRVVNPKDFATESYEHAASLVTTGDPTVKEAVVLLPGKSKTVTVRWSEPGQLAVQALLHAPFQDAWRVLLPDPPPETVQVRLEERRVCRVVDQGQGECWPMER